MGLARERVPRYWLHLLLLLLTLITTTAVGSRMVWNFRTGRPAFSLDDFEGVWNNLRHPTELPAGLLFSLPLMTILLAHELGHYLACRRYHVNASLPYFIPGPPLIGTFGAFIRIRSPICTKRALFDIGISGPLVGFAFLLPALLVGLALSKVIPGIADQGDYIFGTPMLLWALEKATHPGIATVDIYLHPVARAAWIGIFATALNLLPIGQLDGGHILYAMLGERHKWVSRVFVAALVPLGIVYWPWWAWAIAMLIIGLRHPAIFDPAKLDRRRKLLGWLALAIFALCFMPAPIVTYNR